MSAWLDYTVRLVALMLLFCMLLNVFSLCVLHTAEVLIRTETKMHTAW